jgi:UDP:flavonoid glycosyltransferase YjiC (YdhE family)
MIRPYLQQQDVIAHPNVKVFFFHFGGNAFFEAIWHAVPMVGIPIMVDQIDHATSVKEKKIGLVLGKYATGDEIYNAIVRVRDDNQ